MPVPGITTVRDAEHIIFLVIPRRKKTIKGILSRFPGKLIARRQLRDAVKPIIEAGKVIKQARFLLGALP